MYVVRYICFIRTVIVTSSYCSLSAKRPRNVIHNKAAILIGTENAFDSKILLKNFKVQSINMYTKHLQHFFRWAVSIKWQYEAQQELLQHAVVLHT